MRDELLRIEYGLERLLWQDPNQDQLDVWDVTVQTSEFDDQAETGVNWHTVARAVLYGIDIDRCLRVGESPFEVTDAHSAHVAYDYEHVLEVGGDFQPDVQEASEWPPTRVLFLHDVNVDASPDYPPLVFAFHDRVEVGPTMVRKTLLKDVGLTETEALELL